MDEIIDKLAHTVDTRKSTHELLLLAIPIIQDMATSRMILADDSDYYECPYCPLSSVPLDTRRSTLKPEEHDVNCPIRLAAAWLEQWRITQS